MDFLPCKIATGNFEIFWSISTKILCAFKYDDTHSDQKFSESELFPHYVETPTR